jgi:DDE superfamily endonuclease
MDGTMRSQGRPHRLLWNACWCAIQPLRTAFSYHATFMWFATIVVGMMVRPELRGVTSIVRALNLRPDRYNPLRRCFHSTAIKLDQLTALWVQAVLRLFTNPVRFNGRLVLVGDGVKAAKRGRKMPAVKLLHQQSNCSTKPEYIMGHSMQAVALLVNAASSVFAVPLAIHIHEGLLWSNRDKRTLLDKMLDLIKSLKVPEPCYFVADTYYAAGKVVNGLLRQGNHLVSRVKSNAVAWFPPEPQSRPGRGRPKLYGRKIRIKSLASDVGAMDVAVSPVYGERGVKIRYRVCDLMWRPVGRLVRFVAVVHPTRGTIVLMTTDLSLEAMDIIRIYGLRFKIELTFKQAAHQIGLFAYHFWMMEMMPLRYRNGNQYLHRATDEYRDQVRRKIRAYHVFMQAGAIAHGLLQYLASEFTEQVWASFGSWLRTIRPGVPPSEFVVENVMRQTLPDFLVNGVKTSSLAKFIAEQQDADDPKIFRLAS